MSKTKGLVPIRCPHDCSGKSENGKLLFRCSSDFCGEYEGKCTGRKKCIISFKNNKLELTPTVFK